MRQLTIIDTKWPTIGLNRPQHVTNFSIVGYLNLVTRRGCPTCSSFNLSLLTVPGKCGLDSYTFKFYPFYCHSYK